MNNQGWGLKEMLFFCAVFILIIVMVSAALDDGFKETENKKQKEEVDTYYTIEVKMVNAMKNYIYENYNDVNEITIDISLSKLIKERYIGKIKDPHTKEECNGYVIFTKKENNITYDPYLKCGDEYITSGYELQYENQ